MSDEAKRVTKKAQVTPEELASLCVEIAEDRKAENVVQLRLTELSVIADYFVLCTGNTEPHIKAIADRIGREVREKLSVRPRAVEGKASSSWVVMDYGFVIVHIMTPEMRDLYQLENLWGDAPKVETIEKIEKIRQG